MLGASGSGKTTLLHLLASLKKPNYGLIEINGTELHKPRPETGLILQNHGLLPWATVEKNIELGFKIRRFYGPDGKHSPANYIKDIEQEKKAVKLWMDKMGIGELKNRYPRQISGGQLQRTAIARTLILKPDLLLMDEPFSSLDPGTRASLQKLVVDLNIEKTCSRVLVTHSIEEALIMGSRILVLRKENEPPLVIDNPGFKDRNFRESPVFDDLFRKLDTLLGESHE